MQSEAADAFDIGKEPEKIRAMYGSGVHGRQTLIARRLLERGVRFIQLWHGAGQPWDSHADIKKNHGKLGLELDQPIAAFITDLKQRGMLDDTLIIIGGEFGRTPVSEGGSGRDHNPYGFTYVLAGGGVKGATSTAPPTISVSARSRTSCMSTIFTRRSCICLGSTTKNSPTVMRGGISG